MDAKTRKLLFKPLSKGTLSAIVPDLRIELKNGKKIRTSALLTSNRKKFQFTIHFMRGEPPAGLGRVEKRVVTVADQIMITGQINGELAFRCCDVFPPAGCTTRSRGTSTIKLSSQRMELIVEGSEKWNARKIRKALGISREEKKVEAPTFDAHIIFHGPKLRMRDAGSKTTRANDFLGEAVSSSFDTHIFSGSGYEAGLIQKDNELHLHLKSRAADPPILDPSELIDRVICSVGFAFGFHPWPVYREIRINYRIVERWVSPKLRLKQTFIAPVSESLWSTFAFQKESPLNSIIPTIAAGLGALKKEEQDRIGTLLWNVRSSALSDLPVSTKLLILSSSFDGLMKVIAGFPDASQKDKTDKIWRKASDLAGFNWEKWTKDIFELWGKYRHRLSHGRFWGFENGQSMDEVLDYGKLGCAFMIMVAARCGYTGPILANPFELRAAVISQNQQTK